MPVEISFGPTIMQVDCLVFLKRSCLNQAGEIRIICKNLAISNDRAVIHEIKRSKRNKKVTYEVAILIIIFSSIKNSFALLQIPPKFGKNER